MGSTVVAAIIYSIIIFILSIILLPIWYYTLYYYYQDYQCASNPNIWCWNDFTCQTPSQDSSCYNLQSDSLPQCLYGADTPVAQNCLAENNENGTCTCPQSLDDTTSNCFASCPVGRSNVSDNTTCQIVK
tara:strand:+ start:113 stop:502 length:390 start_codon:yes stop_codon:yes gene_type:complete